MMRTLILVAGTLAIGSCSEETRQELFGAARIIPSAQIDASVYTVSGVDAEGSVLPFIPAPDELSFKLSNADGSYSHTWPLLSDYPVREPLLTGVYKAEVSYGSEYGEGIDAPYFYGATTINLLSDGSTEAVCVTAHLANTIWRISYTDEFSAYFQNARTTLHAVGGGYIEIDPSVQSPVFLRPGTVKVFMAVDMPSGESVEFTAATVQKAQAAHLYNIIIDMRMASDGVTPQVILSFDESTATDDVIIALTREFLESEAPELSPYGFTDGQTVEIAEGTTPPESLGVVVRPASMSHLVLTSKTPSLLNAGWPSEIDLMEATSAQLTVMRQLGLTISDNPDGTRRYDFTGVLPNLRTSDGQISSNTLSLIATSGAGRATGPLTLNIDVTPVDISIMSVSPVIIGVNQAQIHIVSSDANLERNLTIETRASADNPWQPAPITSVTADGDNRWYVNFNVPQSADATVDIRLLYCSQEKAQYTLKRVAPTYTVAVDAFALLALIKIDAGSADMTSLITSLANIYIDGNPTLQLTRRPESGYIVVGGLAPNRKYSLSTTMFDAEDAAANPSGFTPSVSFTTEADAPIPNGDFDEIRAHDIKYKNLPAGGRYSQNIVEIYNRQNYVSYDLSVPKHWANTNSKTFCTGASRHNSWYMVPTVFTTSVAASGAYAVVVRSASWDINGEAIPDYRQTSQPYTDYSRVVPAIAHRAAGKLFLGSYEFNPSTMRETYNEGVEFHSRPTALNGYYSFIPALTDVYDQGMAIVEIIGNESGAEIVIARGEYFFTPATSFTAFSIPLIYNDFGRKATKLKILFASSRRIGSIDEETASVVTYPNLSQSMALGNELCLDNLTFSY